MTALKRSAITLSIQTHTHPWIKKNKDIQMREKLEPQRFRDSAVPLLAAFFFFFVEFLGKVGHFKSLTPILCFDIEQQEGPRTVEWRRKRIQSGVVDLRNPTKKEEETGAETTKEKEPRKTKLTKNKKEEKKKFRRYWKVEETRS